MKKDLKELKGRTIISVSTSSGWFGGSSDEIFVTKDFEIYKKNSGSITGDSRFKLNEGFHIGKLTKSQMEDLDKFIIENFKGIESFCTMRRDSMTIVNVMYKDINVKLVNGSDDLSMKIYKFLNDLYYNSIKEKKIKSDLDIIFLLDKSGSMDGVVDDTIGGFNNYLDNNIEKNALVTTVLFNDNVELTNIRKDIKNVEHLNKETYKVWGSTALYDAIGKTIKFMDDFESLNNKVLLVITTDGQENSSIEYDKNKIKKMLEEHKNYEVIFIGADIDSYAEGSKLGLDTGHIANYTKSKDGVKKMFRAVECCSYMIENDKKITDDWKKELN